MKYYILFLFLIFSCSTKRDINNYSLNIEFKNSNNEEITIEKVKSDYSIELIKSDFLDNDNYKIDLLVNEPTLFRLNIVGKNSIDFVLENNDVNISIDGNDISVIGSVGTDNLTIIKKYINDYQDERYELNRSFIQASRDDNKLEILKIRNQSEQLENNFTKNFKKLIWNMDNSIASFFVADYLKIDDHFNFWDSLILKYEKDLGYTSYYKALNEKFNRIKVLSIGQYAPEISLNDPDENQLTLSSLRGKYVLLDFWAAWCRPCRVENPNIVKMYNKYKNYGFEVFQVSLDRDKSTWINAINKDGLNELNHVSDLKFWKSDAAITYNIKSIPASFFIDPDGKIIAKNLRGPRLEKKLSEIF
tara:strand:- start:2619 stop:3701 length:1083 start_codon:yes stop_codon:yes gene_type:complete